MPRGSARPRSTPSRSRSRDQSTARCPRRSTAAVRVPDARAHPARERPARACHLASVGARSRRRCCCCPGVVRRRDGAGGTGLAHRRSAGRGQPRSVGARDLGSHRPHGRRSGSRGEPRRHRHQPGDARSLPRSGVCRSSTRSARFRTWRSRISSACGSSGSSGCDSFAIIRRRSPTARLRSCCTVASVCTAGPRHRHVAGGLTLSDVRQYHAAMFQPDGATLVLAGSQPTATPSRRRRPRSTAGAAIPTWR